jgi:hypothetical protein
MFVNTKSSSQLKKTKKKDPRKCESSRFQPKKKREISEAMVLHYHHVRLKRERRPSKARPRAHDLLFHSTHVRVARSKKMKTEKFGH